MKKILIKGVLLASIFSGTSFLSSCNDALEILQPGELTDEVLFTSVDNLEGYLLGAVYASLEPGHAFYTSAVLSDEVKPGASNAGQEQLLHRFFIDGSNPYVSDVWLNNNRSINRVNRLLDGAKKFTPAESEKAKYDNIIAQARALRAYSYLQLQTYFSPDMANPEALGVLLMKNVPLSTDKLQRSPNKDINQLIEEDLQFARGILKNGTTQYYVDINFVNAVDARFNLYIGNHELAKKYANDVVSSSGLTLTLATPIVPEGSDLVIGTPAWNTAFYAVATSNSFNPYRKIWDDSARGEVIFSANRQASGIGVAIGSFFNTNTSSITGSPMWGWGRNLFNILNTTDGDIRRLAYVDPSSRIDPNYLTSLSPVTTDQLIVDKYPGKVSSATRNDVKIFRLSEMYFILAEAAVADNNLAEARDRIHAVRVARNYKDAAFTPNYTSAAVAYEDILKERRVELALEGHRYIDLKRLAVKANVSMDRNQTDDIVRVENLENGSYKYTFPIPLNEIAGNPTIQQNPGYAK